MIAIRSFGAGLPVGGRNALDLPVAALAGLSVAFLAYAAPPDALADLVAGTGLPALLPAAEPPLGLKARIAIGVGGSLIAFLLAYALMRALDRVGSRRTWTPVRDDDEDEASSPPRLRRRDLHPDAPPRPPLLATLELGDPLPPAAPLWLQPAEIEPKPPSRPVPEPEAARAPVQDPKPEIVRAPPPEPVLPEPEVDFMDEGIDEAEPSLAPVQPPSGEPNGLPEATPTGAQSLDELMQRLERGLGRRAGAPAESPEPAPLAAADDRLQSAIESLHRFASRQGD